MQILNIAILMNLCNFEVVDLLDHLLELAHNGLNLAWVRYTSLVEDRLVLSRLNIGAELEVLSRLPFEDDADQQLHAKTDDAFFIWVININSIW